MTPALQNFEERAAFADTAFAPARNGRHPPGPNGHGDGAAHDPFWLGKRLVELKRISPEQLRSAIEDFRRRPSEPFPRALERLSLASQKIIAQLTAEHHGLAWIEIPPATIPPALAKRLPQLRARNYGAVPCREDGPALTVAVTDPSRYTSREAEHDFPGEAVHFVVAPRNDVLAAIDAAHTPPLPAANPKELLIEILNDAVANRASDVHFEQKPHDIHVRYRIDNQMVHRHALGAEMKAGIIQAIKSLAGSDLAQKKLPQDGQGRHVVGATSYNLRVSVIPTITGENACVRLQDETRNFGSLAELGLSPEQIALFVKLISVPNGLFYTTGPTGSGKTTLQYALLATQDLSSEKVVTAENPVEYQFYNYTQCSIDEKSGRTFEALLEAFLRHDPDVIMIGETRSFATAQVAIRSALTGHRVFSTLHTNDAASAVARLIDLGVEPYLVSSAVKASCATRLVQKLCPACARPARPETLAYLRREYGPGDYLEPAGCETCSGTGYRGRTAILEIFPLTDESTQQLILQKVPTSEVSAHLQKLGYRTMRDDGIAKAKAGITTVQEVLSQV
jgi:type II secretory ATPase GspE/PulE/Tfp pilus assembly ATPase PilB-like protein